MQMAKLSNKLFDIFRNLKTDAIPRSPRPENVTVNEEENVEQSDENADTTHTEVPEEIFIEQHEHKKEKKKSKFKKTFFKPNKSNFNDDNAEDKDDRRRSSSSNIHTQASGNVINIVNSPDFHWGNNLNYYFGHKVNKAQKEEENDGEEEVIPKCNLITLLMEAKEKPEHEYIDYISKNLGRNWRAFFRKLGYTKGRIETVEIDESKHGVSEARYKLLLDWTRNSDGTLGCLANMLWNQGERQVVKELSVIYNKNQN